MRILNSKFATKNGKSLVFGFFSIVMESVHPRLEQKFTSQGRLNIQCSSVSLRMCSTQTAIDDL